MDTHEYKKDPTADARKLYEACEIVYNIISMDEGSRTERLMLIEPTLFLMARILFSSVVEDVTPLKAFELGSEGEQPTTYDELAKNIGLEDMLRSFSSN
jgi:hypothetical protein